MRAMTKVDLLERTAQNHGRLMLLNFAPCYRRRKGISSANGRFAAGAIGEGLLEPIQLRASYVANPWGSPIIFVVILATTLANSNSPAAG